jgi:hypothetical protein
VRRVSPRTQSLRDVEGATNVDTGQAGQLESHGCLQGDD